MSSMEFFLYLGDFLVHPLENSPVFQLFGEIGLNPGKHFHIKAFLVLQLPNFPQAIDTLHRSFGAYQTGDDVFQFA